MQHLPNESFADYKERRKKKQLEDKQKSKGGVFWNSFKEGTYRREKKVLSKKGRRRLFRKSER